jgi:S-adenosylmethionine:tRNA ribosyltransferase-isomerase
LLDLLKNNNVTLDYITLHVWIGTFRSIKVDDIRDYDIHSEVCEVDIAIFSRIASYKLSWKNVIAVWTTSCRTLESLIYLWVKLTNKQKDGLCEWKYKDFWNNLENNISLDNNYIQSYVVGVESIQFECKLFIVPWFCFTVVDQLITNFHLPKSSLMVLVASILGYDYMMNAYRIAIQKNYMFYSFGDAMWIY